MHEVTSNKITFHSFMLPSFNRWFNFLFELVTFLIHVLISLTALLWVSHIICSPFVLIRMTFSTCLPPVFTFTETHPTHCRTHQMEREREREKGKRDCACCMFVLCFHNSDAAQRAHCQTYRSAIRRIGRRSF